MPKNSDELYDKELAVYIEKEQELEIKKYEDYREYPVIVNNTGNRPRVLLDTNFAKICHDFGRFLFFNDIEEGDALKEASDFVEKLVKPIKGIVYSGNSKDYERDVVAKSFGIIFVNSGFFHSEENLTEEKISDLTNNIIIFLEHEGLINE